MLAGILSGCGNNSSTSQVDVSKITIWHDKEDAVIEVLQEKVNASGIDVEVVFEKKSDLTEALKMVGNDPKAAPDMYFFAHDKIGVYAEMDILAPITETTEEPMSDRLLNPSDKIAILFIITPVITFTKNKKKLQVIPITPLNTLYCSRTNLSEVLE